MHPPRMDLYLFSVVAGAAAEDYNESDYEDPAKIVVVKRSAKAVTHVSTSMLYDGAGVPLPISSYAERAAVLLQIEFIRVEKLDLK